MGAKSKRYTRVRVCVCVCVCVRVCDVCVCAQWRPQAALARVRWVLRVAAHLQPLLGPDLQSDLQALLFVGSDAAGSAGNSKAHGGLKQTGSEAAVEGGVGVEEGALLSPAPALLPYLQAVSHW